jgi:hypothetical protein
MLFSELHFDGDLDATLLPAGTPFYLTYVENGYAYYLPPNSPIIAFDEARLADVVVEVRLFSAGTGSVIVRDSEAGRYTVTLDAAGQLTLYRSELALASSLVTPFDPNQWRSLRVSAMGDLLRVSVNGVEVLTASDPAPLPAGRIAFVNAADELYVDDFIVWIPQIEGMPDLNAADAPMAMAFQASSFSAPFNGSAEWTTALDSDPPNRLIVGNTIPGLYTQADISYADASGSGTLFTVPASHPRYNEVYDVSPDGKWLAYMCRIGTHADICLVPLSDGIVINITNDTVFDSNPRWLTGTNQFIYNTATSPNVTSLVTITDEAAMTVSMETLDGLTCGGVAVTAGQYVFCMLNGNLTVYDLNNRSAGMQDATIATTGVTLTSPSRLEAVITPGGAIRLAYEYQVPVPNNPSVPTVGWGTFTTNPFTLTHERQIDFPIDENDMQGASRPAWSADGTRLAYFALHYTSVAVGQRAIIRDRVRTVNADSGAVSVDLTDTSLTSNVRIAITRLDWSRLLLEPTPICSFRTFASPSAIRYLPNTSALALLEVPGLTTLYPLYYAIGDAPDFEPTITQWWLVSSGRTNNNGDLIADGWIWAGNVEGDTTGCALSIPQQEPALPPPAPPPPGLCEIQLKPYTITTIRSNDFTTDVAFYASEWTNPAGEVVENIGDTLGDDHDDDNGSKEATLHFYVYALSYNTSVRGSHYYLITPVGRRQPQRYLQANAALPENPNYVQNWVEAVDFDIVSENLRACDYSALGRIPSHFTNHPEDTQYADSLGYYMDVFYAPVDRDIYTRAEDDDFNTPVYAAFRASQRPHNTHWAMDIVYHPPDGRTNDSSEFTVVAPANGVVVDAGPDSITGTVYYTGAYGSFPPWVIENSECARTRFEGNDAIQLCLPYSYVSSGTSIQSYFVQFYPTDPNNLDGNWELMIATRADTDSGDETTLDNEVLNRTGRVADGLLPPEPSFWEPLESLPYRCNNPACNPMPGRQLVIWHEASDGDSSPDIETAYIHVASTDSDYELWHETCSAFPNVRGREDIWQAVYDQSNEPDTSNPCWITALDELGVTRMLGFTSGLHLHYAVAIDWNGATDFPEDEDYFDKPIKQPENTGEWIDPALSIDLDIAPGEGGRD